MFFYLAFGSMFEYWHDALYLSLESVVGLFPDEFMPAYGVCWFPPVFRASETAPEMPCFFQCPTETAREVWRFSSATGKRQ